MNAVSFLENATRKRVTTASGTTVSYLQYGSGPPLVLVHGAFSDDVTNWEFVKPFLEKRFTVFAVARRGRGETGRTVGHRLEDEARDVAAVIESIGEPVFLLGHSYGAQCSLAAAALLPASIRKLVLYEPPSPSTFPRQLLASLEALAAAGAWDDFATTFFRDGLHVPVGELEEVKRSDVWPPIVSDAKATLADLRALVRYDFAPERFAGLDFPVLLQIGSESPRDLYVTDALAAVLEDSRIEAFPGQAHEAMTFAPEMYANAVIRFLLG